MMDFVKLIIPIFYTTKNYEDILKRLAGFTFYETYLITLLLRNNSRVKDFFTSVESWGSVGDALRVIAHYDVLNIAGIVIARLICILFSSETLTPTRRESGIRMFLTSKRRRIPKTSDIRS